MSFLKSYPQIKIIQELAKRKKAKIYLVGGFLRDHLLGVKKQDFDFSVEKDALKIARSFANKIKGAYVLLDEERKCARVVKKQKGEIYTFDFADFRAKTFSLDLSHRDFTINTLSVDLQDIGKETEIEDVIKDRKAAIKALKSKKIIMTSVRVFKEDPLRMMRAFSLRAVLGFKIDKKTKEQIKKDVNLICNVSYERIREELFKILKSSSAAATLKEMDSISLLEKIIPQLRIMFDCKQGGYHHLDVWLHSLETVAKVEELVEELRGDQEVQKYLDEPISAQHPRISLIKFAALVHDIGKPDTRKKEKERLSFHGHERVGEKFVREISRMIKLATRERHCLEDMVMMHLRPGYLSNFKRPGERMIYRFFRDAGEEAVSVLLLSLADQRATRGPLTTDKNQAHHQIICMNLIRRYFVEKKKKPFVALINGNDVMRKLKIKPSALVGKILAEIKEKQILGKIKTKKEALELIKSMGNLKSKK